MRSACTHALASTPNLLIGDAETMDYFDAITAVTDDLATGKPGEPARAALRLASLAWRELADSDTSWDRFGLEVLAVCETLSTLPETVLLCDPPAQHNPQVRVAVAGLMQMLATHLDVAAANESVALVDRLTFDAAAVRLRGAARALL